MDFENLTEEQKEKARACKSAEELLALAKEEGYELTDEQMETVAGGGWFCDDHVCETYRNFAHC